MSRRKRPDRWPDTLDATRFLASVSSAGLYPSRLFAIDRVRAARAIPCPTIRRAVISHGYRRGSHLKIRATLRRVALLTSPAQWCARDRGAVCKSRTLKCETARGQTGRQFAKQPFHQEILQ